MRDSTIDDVRLEFESFISSLVLWSEGDASMVEQSDWQRALSLYRTYSNGGWARSNDYDGVLDAFYSESEK